MEERHRERVIISLDLVGALIWAAILGAVVVLAVIGTVCLLGGR